MKDKHTKIFNVIAPIYAKFYDYQVDYFQKTIHIAKKELDITRYKTILDIGCGTGALCYVLYKNGLEVTGVDVAKKMVDKSKEKLRDLPITIIQVDPEKEFPFPDKSFDLVISSYVAHGLKPEHRMRLYKEASRLAKEKVIFHDFNQKRSLQVTIIEWLEGGDYFNFIKLAEREMRAYFKQLKVLQVHKQAAWYIGDIPKIKEL